MTTQQSILLASMQTLQQAYYSGRLKCNGEDTGGDGCVLSNLWIHEGDDTPSISIDLYNFGGDGKDVCDGLEFDVLLSKKKTHLHAFCISYNSDLEDNPLLLQCEDGDDYDCIITADQIPDTTCANITNWLREQVKPHANR